jgi:uncharacterized protein (TIGR03067 family)
MQCAIRFSALFAILLFVGIERVRADVKTISGVVKTIDAKKRVLSVETDGKTKDFEVSSKAKITSEGTDVALDALKTEQNVRVSYHDDLNVVVKIESLVERLNENDLTLLQGEWVLANFENSGKQIDDATRNSWGICLIIKDTTLVQFEKGIIKRSGNLKFDQMQKHIDFSGVDNLKQSVEWLGLYDVSEDKLRLRVIWNNDGKASHPTSFKTEPRVEGRVDIGYTFRRAKSDDSTRKTQ